MNAASVGPQVPAPSMLGDNELVARPTDRTPLGPLPKNVAEPCRIAILYRNEFSNCSNADWFAVTVFAGPVNLMNTFPPGPSKIAPSIR
jgi:hypothetical protein